jgi:phosphoribosylamine---glycine ligase
MKVLLIGSGGREHAIAWKLSQSPKLTKLFTLPGNPGTAELGENLPGPVSDLDRILQIAVEKKVDLVVVGPEDPLAAGLADRLMDAGIPTFGPSKAAARLEASKAFAKDFMTRHGIPTAAYRTFSDFEEARDYITDFANLNKAQRASYPKPPAHEQPDALHLAPGTLYLPVIKASGLAAGKGVILPESLAEAESALREIMLEKRFGDAGTQVVIEERLAGREVSILAFSDGKTALPMVPAQDHKRLLDNDEGPNTGGMGVFAPSPFCPPELVREALERAILPAIRGLAEEGSPFVGVLYAGLIQGERGLQVLEYNCRFGDPETQAVLPLLEADLFEIMQACADGDLGEMAGRIRWKNTAAVCLVLASGGYPEAYPKGVAISGLDKLPEHVVAFHAGTRREGGQLVTNGGRVLGLTALADDLPAARARAYEAAARVHFEGMHFRSDIGIGI